MHGDPSNSSLHPIFDRVLNREEKELRLGQRARVIWLFGLSGSGKSTLAVRLERALAAEGVATHLLDGDNLRTGLNRGLGFSEADRAENLRRAAEVARLFVQAGVVTLASFITPFREHREQVRAIIGNEDLSFVYVSATYETCRQRDPKGLYARADAGGVSQFTGRDSRFEEPQAGESSLVLETEREDVSASLARLLAHVRPLVRGRF